MKTFFEMYFKWRNKQSVWDIVNCAKKDSAGFYHGPLIHHTKVNNNRKIYRALSADQIRNLERHLKYKWPIRWKIQEEIFPNIRVFFKLKIMKFDDFMRWMQRKVDKRYRYNEVHISSLTSEYSDIDTRILHSTMELFVQFYKNGSWEHWDDCGVEEQQKAALEIYEIGKWWLVDRPKREEHEDVLWKRAEELKNSARNDLNLDEQDSFSEDFLFPLSREFKRTDYYQEYSDIMKELSDLEVKYYEEDNEMLQRVIKIRRYLWT